MCDYCKGEKFKQVRIALAAKAIGKFAGQATKDSSEGIEPFVEDVVREFGDMNRVIDKPGPCAEMAPLLTVGVKKSWATLTVEQKFEMALMAGAVKIV